MSNDNKDINYKELMDDINQSVNGLSFDCPRCGAKDNHCCMQSLGLNKDGKCVDFYDFRCSCGHEYMVESKPLLMMAELEAHLFKRKDETKA